jgi:PST family polysaccharide transporter
MTISGQTQLKELTGAPLTAEPLYGRAMSALSWRFLSESSRFILQLTVMVILARLIRVDQFGLLALAMVVINLVIDISEIGVHIAVVQRKDLTDIHIRVAFSLSIIFGLLFTIAVYLFAPFAAILLQSNEVIPILRLISVTVLLTSSGKVAMALLQRKLNYRNLLIVELGSYAFGYVLVGISLALLGYGVWALVWASLIQALLKTILLFHLAPHPMRPSLSLSEARQLLNIGVGQSLFNLAYYAAVNGDYFVVGRQLGTTALGLYSRAYQLLTMPMYQFTSVISSVLFPVYSLIQDESERLKRAYLASLSLSAIIVAPVLACLGVAAPEIMTGVFGPEWIGAAAPLQILCIGGLFHSMAGLGDSLARAKGAVYLKFACHSIYAACVFSFSFIGSRWGINGVAVGVVVAITVIYLLMARLTTKLVGASWKEYFLCQAPGAILGVVAAAFAILVTHLLRSAHLPCLFILAGAVITSTVAGVLAGLSLPRAWLNNVSFGAIDNIEQLADTVSRRSLAYLSQNRFAFKLVATIFNWYKIQRSIISETREGRRATSRQANKHD